MSQWKKNAKYQDLGSLPEDERIVKIAEALKLGMVVGVCVDDVSGKPERYIEKLRKIHPTLRVTDQFKGPVAGVVTIKVILEQARN